MNRSGILITMMILTVLYLAFQLYTTINKADEGELAPTIEATLVDGSPFKLEDLKGNYVVLDFWASWCGPCRVDIPKLIALQNKYKGKNVKIVSLALEKNKGAGKRFAQNKGFNWPYQIEEVSQFVAMNKNAINYGVTDIPANFLINPDGKLIGQMTLEEIKRNLESAILSDSI